MEQSEPKTYREWLAVLLRTFLPPVWKIPPLVKRGMAIHCQSSVRTLERKNYAQYFDRIETRLFRWELRRRSVVALYFRALRRLGFLQKDSTSSPSALSGRPIK